MKKRKMKNKLLFVLLLVSSFAFGQKYDSYYPINRINKKDTVINKINLASLHLQQAAKYQQKSLNISLIGVVATPLIAYVGFTTNNKNIIHLSYAVGFTFAFNVIDLKLKSIESLRQAGENLY
jgi:hypothetical protein